MRYPIDPGQDGFHLSIKRVVLVCAIFLTAVKATPVSAVTPAVLIDTQLQPHRVNIQGLVDGVISYFDADRRLQVEPMSQFVQVRVVKNTSETALNDTTAVAQPTKSGDESTGTIELVDGQRLVGDWVGVDDQTQALIWRHASLGRLNVPLDQLYALRRSGPPMEGEAPPIIDELELVNGDQVTGYAIGVNTAGVEFQLEEDGHVLEIGIDQVRILRLANPVARRQNGRSMVWLSDGTHVLAESISIATDQITIQTSLATEPDTVSLPMSQVDRIDWASAGGYLMDLADLPFRVLDEGSVFGLAIKPRVEGTSILLHAPIRVAYTLPPGVERLWALAESGGDLASERALAWMDFEAIIAVDGKTKQREHFHIDRRSVVLNLAVSGQTMTIELDPAKNGPMMDQLVLRDAVVFVRPPVGKDTAQ